MVRGIDHLVLCVNDLKNARTVYDALGFTLTPQAQHPFGTGNIIAQLDGCFLEILSVTQPDDIPPAAAGAFNFAAFNRDYLAQHQGMSMLVLDSRDEMQDRQDFIDAGLNVFAPFEFQRQQTLPDGNTATVGFSLTFADDAMTLPGLGFFTCKQWRPDLFWKPAYQTHANGAQSVSEVYIVAPDPAATAPFLSGFAGTGRGTADNGDLVIDTTRGAIRVMTPRRFEQVFAKSSPDRDPTRPFFAGYALKVDDLGCVAALWHDAGIPFARSPDSIWIGPDAGLGCVIAVSD